MIRWSFKKEATWMLWLNSTLPLLALAAAVLAWLGGKISD